LNLQTLHSDRRERERRLMLELAGRAEDAGDRGDSTNCGRDWKAIEAFVGNGDVRRACEVAIRGDDALRRPVCQRSRQVDRIDFRQARLVPVLCGDREPLVPLGLNRDETVLTIRSEQAEVREPNVARSLRDRD